ncbi:MAG: glycosyl transferase [Alphaproteobacteria bacterium]|nr:glycosyl transferase [Alphaproteobacteria bacterium]
MRALLAVNHLQGVGHLRRALRVAGAFAARGVETHIANGGRAIGMPVPPGVRQHDLPSIAAADASYGALVGAAGPVDEAYLERRRARLLDLVDEIGPTLLVTEHFPFGRGALRDEYLRLVAAARAHGARVLASVRDIVEPPRAPGRAERQLADAQLFDAILVHGDPRLAALEESLPHVAGLRHVFYTGLVTEAPAPAPRDPARAIVSAGGGATGAGLFEAALRAAALPEGRALTWHVRQGWHAEASPPVAAPPNVAILPPARDFPAELAQAGVSVSQAGYNTVGEALAAATPMVLVPHAGPGQAEQTFRAQRFAARGLAEHVPEARLSPERLLAAVLRARERGAPAHGLALDGAARSAETSLALADRAAPALPPSKSPPEKDAWTSSPFTTSA